MNARELPSAETIAKYRRNGHVPQITHLAPITKTGTPVATEKKNGEPYDLWIEVTPAMAADWLKNNFGNRPIKEDVVVAYARDMVNGVWVATHQGLAFDVDDRLIDGQHRLKAVILANKTVRMKVSFNLPAKIEGSEMTTMDCVDRGRTRSVADQLTIQHGFKYGSLTASICAALASLCCGERTRRLSVGQTLEVYRAFESAIQFVIEHRSKEAGLKSAGVAAAFALALGREGSAELIRKMFFQLNAPAGDEDKKFPVIALLRAFLISDEAKLISRSLDRGLAEMTLQVLFLEVHGLKIEKLEMSLAGADWFRAEQKERVTKIAGIFKLPAPAAPAAAVASVPATVPASRQEIKCVEPAPEPAPKKNRPTLDLIMGKVEGHTKLSKFILTGRGSDPEIDQARSLFVHLARSVGHTDEAVALYLKRSEATVHGLHLDLRAMPEKLRKAADKLKASL